jgi:hypothetical protein
MLLENDASPGTMQIHPQKEDQQKATNFVDD